MHEPDAVRVVVRDAAGFAFAAIPEVTAVRAEGNGARTVLDPGSGHR